jgi:hypothetical protein
VVEVGGVPDVILPLFSVWPFLVPVLPRPRRRRPASATTAVWLAAQAVDSCSGSRARDGRVRPSPPPPSQPPPSLPMAFFRNRTRVCTSVPSGMFVPTLRRVRALVLFWRGDASACLTSVCPDETDATHATVFCHRLAAEVFHESAPEVVVGTGRGQGAGAHAHGRSAVTDRVPNRCA